MSLGRRLRLVLPLATVAVAVVALTWIRDDIAYFFASREGISLGNVTDEGLTDAALAKVSDGDHVRLKGAEDIKRSLRITGGRSGEKRYRVFALVTPGRGDAPIVVRVADRAPPQAKEPAIEAFSGSGRAILWERLDSVYDTLKRHVATTWALPEGARPKFLVLGGETPGDKAWAIAVAATLLAVMALNVWVLVRAARARRLATRRPEEANGSRDRP